MGTPTTALMPKNDGNPQTPSLPSTISDDNYSKSPESPTKWGTRLIHLKRMLKYTIPLLLLIILGLAMLPSASYDHVHFNTTSMIISTTACLAFFWAYMQFIIISRVSVEDMRDKASVDRIDEIHGYIHHGLNLYMIAKFKACGVFVAIFSIVVFAWISYTSGDVLWGFCTTFSFWAGAFTSMSSGYVGMKIAMFANVRTTVCTEQQYSQGNAWSWSFNTPFRAGMAHGLQLCGFVMMSLYCILAIMRVHYDSANDWYYLSDAMSGFGLGTSVVAIFGRVMGGIFTKSVDLGADMVGKVMLTTGVGEDDGRNPAAIADYVGDNVGQVLGMSVDLFGSLSESVCAVLILGSSIGVTVLGGAGGASSAGWDAMVYPIAIFCMGILVSLVCSLITTSVRPVTTERSIESSFKIQLFATTALLLPMTYMVSESILPEQSNLQPIVGEQFFTLGPFEAWLAVSCGSIGALLMGLVTEYYTSHGYTPVREVADSCRTGAATNLIYGLSLGYKSSVVPSLLLAFVIYYSYALCDMYGVGLASVGFLANMATVVTMDTYAPICDNAGGIAEMAKLDNTIRQRTRVLNFAGVSFAAIGKGHAIGSASLVSISLLGAFLSRVRLSNMIYISGVNTIDPLFFTFLVVGGMLPFAFSAMTMKSVATTAMAVVGEVKDQFDHNPSLLTDNQHSSFEREKPDYMRCVVLSTQKSLQEMIQPLLLIVLSPLICGLFFGVISVTGLMIGCIISSIQLSLSMSNSGGAWSNAKKYIERATGEDALRAGTSNEYMASLVGDSLGDPLKDTAGPALNVMMKGMAIISVVFADVFLGVNQGRGVYMAGY